MQDDDDAEDLESVAYVAEVDDESGPGCLVIIGWVAALSGLVAMTSVIIYGVVTGMFEGLTNKGGNPGIVFGLFFMVMVGIVSIVAGGGGIGVSLYAIRMSVIAQRNELKQWATYGLIMSGITLIIAVTFLVFLIASMMR